MLLHIRNPDLRAAEAPRPAGRDPGRQLEANLHMACFHAKRAESAQKTEGFD